MHSDVQKWIAQLAAQRSPATVRKVHRVQSRILAAAVKDDRLAGNPAIGVSLPRVVSREQRYLTHEQVHALAQACGRYRLVVLSLAYTGGALGRDGSAEGRPA
jgi:integrase